MKQFFFPCAVWLCALVFVVLGVELILHFAVSPLALGMSEPVRSYRFHPSTFFDLRAEEEMDNVNGFTVHAYGAWRREQKKRILVLGDSYSMLWPLQLQRFIDRAGAGSRYVVINTAVPGFNTWQELQKLRGVISEIRPNVIVTQWGTNDAARAFLYVGEGIALPYPASDLELRQKTGAIYSPLEAFLARNSRLYQIFLQRYPPAKSRTNDGFPHLLLNAENHETLPAYVKELHALQTFARNNGAETFFAFFGLLIQNFPQICRAPWTSTARDCDYLEAYGPQRFFSQALGSTQTVNVIQKLGAPLHPTLVWKDFGHFAPLGDRIVAAIILEELLPTFAETETVRLREILEEEQRWQRAFGEVLATGQFDKVDSETASTQFCIHADFRAGATYFTSVQGEKLFENPVKVEVSQSGRVIWRGEFALYTQPDAQNLLPRSFTFQTPDNSDEICVNLKAPAEIAPRTWVLSGGLPIP